MEFVHSWRLSFYKMASLNSVTKIFTTDDSIGSKGERLPFAPPPSRGSIGFICMQFLQNTGQDNRLVPQTLRLAPPLMEILDPPLENVIQAGKRPQSRRP